MPARGIRIQVMSIRISEGGRLFGIVAGLGGAVMIGAAALTWTKVVRVTHFTPFDEISELNRADRIAMLVLGLLVIASAACFIALRSRRARMTAGGREDHHAAGLIIGLVIDPSSFAGSPVGLPCQPDLSSLPCIATIQGDGRVLGGWGAVLAACFGIVGLLRSGGEAHRAPAAGRSPTVPSGATPSGDSARPHKRRMSDAALLALILIALVIAFVVGLLVFVQIVCSQPGEWC
jgi:hypothetical protein